MVLNSELVRILDDDGRRVVLAHEAAHVHSDHVLYRTALLILLRLGSSVRLPILAGLPLLAIQLALLEWSRAAELSLRPRRGARDPRPAGGLPRADGDGRRRGGRGPQPRRLHRPGHGLHATAAAGLERMTKLLQDLSLTHPMPVRRVRMLLDWVREGDYDRMVRGDYLRRGEEPTAREEAEAAGAFYADRIAARSPGGLVGRRGRPAARRLAEADARAHG